MEIETPKPMLEYCNILQRMEQFHTLKDSIKETTGAAQFLESPKLISEAQKECATLKKLIEDDYKNQLSVKNIEGVELAQYKNKIYVLDILKENILEWYHKMLVHPGTSRLEAALRQVYWWPNLRIDVEKCCKHCQMCQLAKKQKKKYSKIPAKKAEELIWNRVNVDLWGPATVNNTKQGKLKMHLMTMIDQSQLNTGMIQSQIGSYE